MGSPEYTMILPKLAEREMNVQEPQAPRKQRGGPALRVSLHRSDYDRTFWVRQIAELMSREYGAELFETAGLKPGAAGEAALQSARCHLTALWTESSGNCANSGKCSRASRTSFQNSACSRSVPAAWSVRPGKPCG